MASDAVRPRQASIWPRGTHILIAATPKSASTFLSNALGRYQGLRKVSLVPGWHRREQELCPRRLGQLQWRSWVAQHHVRYHAVTEELIRRHAITPVVLVRDLFDSVISLADHFRSEDTAASMAYVRRDFLDWDDRRLHHFIADAIIPWYVNFYVSWLDCPAALWVNYDEVRLDPVSVLQRILEAAGHRVSARATAAAFAGIETLNSRRNRAISGRGLMLDTEVRDKILSLTAYYEGVDFSKIGIVGGRPAICSRASF